MNVRYWWKADVERAGSPWQTDSMLDFQCWVCGEGIGREDNTAVLVSVENLWRWAMGQRESDDPFQNLYLHSRCAKARLAGATMELEPSVFGEDD